MAIHYFSNDADDQIFAVMMLRFHYFVLPTLSGSHSSRFRKAQVASSTPAPKAGLILMVLRRSLALSIKLL